MYSRALLCNYQEQRLFVIAAIMIVPLDINQAYSLDVTILLGKKRIGSNNTSYQNKIRIFKTKLFFVLDIKQDADNTKVAQELVSCHDGPGLVKSLSPNWPRSGLLPGKEMFVDWKTDGSFHFRLYPGAE